MGDSTVTLREATAIRSRPRRSLVGSVRAFVVGHPDQVVIAAILVASVARLAYGTVVGHRVLGPDETTYAAAGRDLVDHGLFSSAVQGLPFWSPGYPMLVGSIYAVFGERAFPVTVVQVVIIGATTWLTYRLGLRVVGRAAAVVAALLMCASLAWLGLATPLMYEQTLALLFVALVLVLLRAEAGARARLGPYIAAGVLSGVAVVVQDKVLTLLPIVVVWLCWGSARSAPAQMRASAAFLVAAMVVVAPFVVRNQVVYDQPLLLTDSHGWNLLIGHHPGADGGFLAIRPERVCDADVQSGDPRVRALTDPGRAGDDDAALTSCAVDYALDTPGREVELAATKAVLFWRPFVGPYENNWSHPFDVRRVVPDSAVATSWFHDADVVVTALWMLAMIALFLGGAVVALRARRRIASLGLVVVGWLLLTHVLTFADPRFRIPVLPLITLYQALGVVAWFGWWRARRSGSEAPGAASQMTSASEVWS